MAAPRRPGVNPGRNANFVQLKCMLPGGLHLTLNSYQYNSIKL